MNLYQTYCTGCGLCKALQLCELHTDPKGFSQPKYCTDTLEKVCPVSGIHTQKLDLKDIWGKNEAVYLGWSNDIALRDKASSGGIISEVARFLLVNKKIDGVIHVGADPSTPTKTKIFISQTPEEVTSHCGSRYCISSPLSEIDKLEKEKKYAFIGKPCDIVALRNYMEFAPDYRDRIPYLISFFCMGLPSDDAQKKLLDRLNCSECKSLHYRGNGWPGYATGIDKNGQTHSITYEESWGKILGRDLMPSCKFCIDGIGEMADISCGDAWYLTEDNKPDFREHDGRNIIFARTVTGNTLLKEMQSKNIITLEEYLEYKTELPYIQTSQWNRRREMKYRILAMKLLFKEYPSYNRDLLAFYSETLSFKHKIKILIGTAKRIIKGKL